MGPKQKPWSCSIAELPAVAPRSPLVLFLHGISFPYLLSIFGIKSPPSQQLSLLHFLTHDSYLQCLTCLSTLQQHPNHPRFAPRQAFNLPFPTSRPLVPELERLCTPSSNIVEDISMIYLVTSELCSLVDNTCMLSISAQWQGLLLAFLYSQGLLSL